MENRRKNPKTTRLWEKERKRIEEMLDLGWVITRIEPMKKVQREEDEVASLEGKREIRNGEESPSIFHQRDKSF